MAAVPLTLETLPSNPQYNSTDAKSLLTTQYQLETESNNFMERPTNLTLDGNHQEQQHVSITPSLLTLTTTTALGGNISPALNSAGSLSPSFLPEMPQWKRDLIQRRKQNVQRTISASSPSTSTAAATSLSSTSPTTISGADSLYGGLKNSTSLSSVRSLADSNSNIDQLAADGLLQQVNLTKDYTTLKVNKQQYATATAAIPTYATHTAKPATINFIKSSTPSPLKEKAEKLFGGQYTAIAFSSSSSSETKTTTTTTKEEIFTQYHHQQQQQQLQQTYLLNKEKNSTEMAENQNNKYQQEQEDEEEEMLKKTKDEHKENRKEKETEHETTTSSIITNKQQKQQEQQMATRLTGSSYTHTTTTSTSSSTTSLLKRVSTTTDSAEREYLHSHFSGGASSITGANMNFVNQSLNKCESERLVCAANTTTTFNTSSNTINNTGNSNNYLNNSGNSSGGSVNSISNSSYNSGGSSANSVNVANVVKISQKLQENQFIKNEQQQLQQKKIIRYQKQNLNLTGSAVGGGLDLKSPTKCFLTTSTSSSSLASATSSSSISTSTAIKKKMVAVQEMKKSTQNSAAHLHPITSTCNAQQQQQQQQQTNRANNRGIVGVGGGGVIVSTNTSNATDLDSSEDLSYGPGIVSKLRCRYLSLALRETMEQQRLNKEHLRRSTSLNNLLDNTEDEENDDDEEDEEEDEDDLVEVGEQQQQESNEQQISSPHHYHHQQLNKKTAGILKSSLNHSQEKRFSHNSQGSNGVGVTFTETSSINKRSRHLKRGNDSLKRARSVEALLSEKSPWQVRNNSSAPTCVTIEDKIHNARERLHQGTDHMPPKRLSSIIDDTERPPPDLVKQTLKMFEATANRRPRLNNRSNPKGDVASKVETFKNIIKEQKPVVNYPKPISPTKKLQKPLKTSTPQASDLLQSPLGRKVMAAASNLTSTDLTPIKSSCSSGNTLLSEHTPDIIPRQTQNKFSTTTERDLKQINKEKVVDSSSNVTQQLIKREHKEKFEVVVDSPLTALTKELGKLKLNDNSNTTPMKKNDNSAGGVSSSVSGSINDNRESESAGDSGGGGVSGAASDNNDDACQRHINKYTHNEEETTKQKKQQQELNIKTLQNTENDKIINNKTKQQINNETTLSAASSSTFTPTPPTLSAIDMKNEATTVNNYDSSLAKTEMVSPPPSSSDLSDGNENDDQDEYAGVSQTTTTTKRITRTALDNIAKAGFTQQFKFNNCSSITSTQNTTTSSVNTSSPLNAGKQIGVIRPLLNTTNNTINTTAQTKPLENMETFKQHNQHAASSSSSPLTSREIEKNRINDLKKSSQNTTSPSNSSASLDNVIKSATSAYASTASAAAASSVSSGFSDVDSVISATNSPLWAMRKRRQTPPAAPAENTTMVFNFSNRKEVPDYIENDGVIFRRKRELPKPNESGFVLLGDLSVETSTDMDYDDFSMCPPSPCDVEFVNANIVIDGKSSIRQKSKETTHYRVQFNDTLTSTFEYPSEASLCVDDSFSAYTENYTQPHGTNTAMSNDFTQAFQNLCLENSSMPQQQQHHHIADEIIQLPTLNASTPAAANSSALNTSNISGGGGASNTPTKNILGNLPLDYPVLEKGIPLITNNSTNIIATTTATLEIASATAKTQHNNEQTIQEKKKSRKDLKLSLGQQHQQQQQQRQQHETKNLLKPPLPVKRFQILNPPAKFINSKNLPGNLKGYAGIQQNNKEIPKNSVNLAPKEDFLEYKPKTRKTPRVLSKPQYACFLQSSSNEEAFKYPIQRSRSNEFQKTYSSSSTRMVTSAQVARSNSLRNLDNFPLKRTPISATTNATPHTLYFSNEVNPLKKFNEKYKPNDVNANEKPLNINASILPESMEVLENLQNELNENSLTQIEISNNCLTLDLNNLGDIHKSYSLLSLPPISQDSQGNTLNLEPKSQSLNDLVDKTENSLLTKSSVSDEGTLTPNCLVEIKTKSLENFNSCETVTTCVINSKENVNSLTNLVNSSNLLGVFDNNTSATLDNAIKSNLVALSEDLVEITEHNDTKITHKALNTNLAAFKDLSCEDANKSLGEKANRTLATLQNTNNDSESKFVAILNNVAEMTEQKTLETVSTNKTNLAVLAENVQNNTQAKLTTLLDNTLGMTENSAMATYAKEFNENKTNLAALNDFQEQLNENVLENENCSESITNLNKKTLQEHSTEELLDSVIEPDNILSVTVSSEHVNNKTTKITESVLSKPKILPQRVYKSPRTLSLTINTDYLTGYSSKIIHKPKKSSKNQPASEQSLSLEQNNFLEYTKDLRKTVNRTQSKSEENLSSPEKSLEKIENPKKSMSCDNFSDVIEYSLHRNRNTETSKDPKTLKEAVNLKETVSSKASTKTINLSEINKSLQMSLDSLDDYEDALAIPIQETVDSVKPLATNTMEASEILEDIAVGIDTESLFDFQNLLNLKRSQTEYCLKNLDKSSNASFDSDNSCIDESETYNSASNTLESKASLKSYKAAENVAQTTACNKEKDGTKKSPKTLRVRTTEKILNFTSMASQNVSSYSTFRKSKIFYKHASKTFKNSLKFYETYGEKSAESATHLPAATNRRSSVKRSIGLTENSGKNVEYNRRMFSKSCRLNRSKTDQNPDSPTENSYSFEYFDAESDRNGNLLNTTTIQHLTDGIVLSPPKDKSLGEKSLNQKSISLQPIPKEFYFNNSPRPFKRLYEAPILVNNRETMSAEVSVKPIDQNLNNRETMSAEVSVKAIDQNLNTLAYKGPISFTHSALNIKPFKACKETTTASEITSSISTVQENNLENNNCVTTERLTVQRSTLRSNSFSVADSIKFYNMSSTNAGKLNNFSSNSLYELRNPIDISGNDTPKEKTLISASQSFRNVENFHNFCEISSREDTSKVFNSLNSRNFKISSSNPQLSTFNSAHPTKNCDKSSPHMGKNNFYAGYPLRKEVSTASCSNNSDEFKICDVNSSLSTFDSLHVRGDTENSTANMENFHNINGRSDTLPGNSSREEVSTVSSSPKLLRTKVTSLKSSDFRNISDASETHLNNFNIFTENTPKIYTNTKYLELKTKLNTTTTPTATTTTTPTLTVKDLIKNTTTTTTTTPITFTLTTTTTATTNFPTKVVVLKNSKSKHISYSNSSFSSSSSSSTVSSKTSAGLCTNFNFADTTTTATTTNKSLITAKYHHHNQKATNPTPTPPLKKYTTANPSPKVLPRRHKTMTSTTNSTTTTTPTIYTSTTTSYSSTTSTSRLKNSTSTCTSGNIIAPPLRRRIPGNTLYYV